MNAYFISAIVTAEALGSATAPLMGYSAQETVEGAYNRPVVSCGLREADIIATRVSASDGFVYFFKFAA